MIATETKWSSILRLFTVWPFTQKVAYPCFWGMLINTAKQDEGILWSRANFALLWLVREGTFWGLCELWFSFPLILWAVLSQPQVVSSQARADDDSAGDSRGTLCRSPELNLWAALCSAGSSYFTPLIFNSVSSTQTDRQAPARSFSPVWPGNSSGRKQEQPPMSENRDFVYILSRFLTVKVLVT